MLIDPIQLEVTRNALIGIAEEMLAALLRTALSPNIRERRDCSTAIFDAAGRMVVQSESIPVHLGAMPFSVRAAIDHFEEFSPGDVIVLNDPYQGGAHLPDITVITPIFEGESLRAIVANRAHHADVGGIAPGSVSGNTNEIFQEGIRIPPIKLWCNNELNQEAYELLLANVRTPIEREGDLRSQYASNETARIRLDELSERLGWAFLTAAMNELLDYSERRMRAEIASIAPGSYSATDFLDDDGRGNEQIEIKVRVEIKENEIEVDFTGTSHQVEGPLNAVLAVTASATYYTIRTLTDPSIPANEGCYRPIKIHAPLGTIVNPKFPAPVVGGNLETSQRIVDTLMKALAEAFPERAIAACQGTMNNITFGGIDPRTGQPFTFYETLAGGFGARATKDGIDGLHSHMTNTLNTPIELLETAFPVRVERYEIREGTGGAGQYVGGCGLYRDIRVLHDAIFTLLADRRVNPPYGLMGGSPGDLGEDLLIRDGIEERLKPKSTTKLQPMDIVSIRTPGSGGFGPPDSV